MVGQRAGEGARPPHPRAAGIVLQRGPRAPVHCACLWRNSLGKFETPPTIPRQEIEEERMREKHTQHPGQWGEETVQEIPALHYTGLLDNPFSNSELRASLRA